MLPPWTHPCHLFAPPPPLSVSPTPPLQMTQHPHHVQYQRPTTPGDFASPFPGSLSFYWTPSPALQLPSLSPSSSPPPSPLSQPFQTFPTTLPSPPFFPFAYPPHLAAIHAPHRPSLLVGSSIPSLSQDPPCASSPSSSATSCQTLPSSRLPVASSTRTAHCPPSVFVTRSSASSSSSSLPNPLEASPFAASPTPSTSATAAPSRSSPAMSPPRQRGTPTKRADKDAKRKREPETEGVDSHSSDVNGDDDDKDDGDGASTVRDQRTYKRYKKIVAAHPIVRALIDENKELRALLRVSEARAALDSVALVRMRSVDPVYIVCVSAPAYAFDKDAADRIARKKKLVSATSTVVAAAGIDAAAVVSSSSGGGGDANDIRSRKFAAAPSVEILLYVYEAHDRRLYFGGPEVALALGLGRRNRAKMSEILAVGRGSGSGGGAAAADHCKIFVRKPRDVGRGNSDPVTCAAVHIERSRMTPPQTTWGLAFAAVRRVLERRKRSNDRAIFEAARELERQLLAFPAYREWAAVAAATTTTTPTATRRQ